MRSSVFLEDVGLTRFLQQVSKQSRMARLGTGEKRNKTGHLQPHVFHNNNDNLNTALGTIRVLGLELTDHELKPHLITVLRSIQDKSRGAPEQVVVSGVLPVLALSLRNRSSQSLLTARLVSELANDSLVRKGFLDSGLVPALLFVLSSPDQDLLIQAATALSRMCHESTKLQDQCLCCGAVPKLVSLLFRFPECPLLEEACLMALCNLSGLGLSEGGMVWERGESVRPGELTFTGSAPLKCGWVGSSVTVVKVTRFAPGQFAVNTEVLQRWSLRGGDVPGRRQRSMFSVVRTGASVYKVIKHWSRNVPRTRNLRTRMFHTFL